MGDSTEIRTTEIDPAVQDVAETEKSLIAAPVAADPKGAQATGKRPGRPRVPVNATRVAFLRAQGRSWREISRELGIGKGTAQRAFYACPKPLPARTVSDISVPGGSSSQQGNDLGNV